MKIHYNEDFDSYMTTEHHITDTIELDGVKLIPVTELEKIKADIKDVSKTLGFINHTTMVCDEDTKLFASMKDIEKMFAKHIFELKGE